MNANDWTAVGSIATAVAVVIALISLVATTRTSQRQREGERASELAEEAANLREAIRTFATTSRELIRELLDGTPLIAASGETVRSLTVMLGPASSTDDLWELLSDKPQTLLAAVNGWSTGPAALEFRSGLAAVSAISEQLSGELNLLSSSGYLLWRIADDGYSPNIFNRLLSDQPLGMFRKEHEGLPLSELLWKLTGHIQGNASLYFAARYEEALHKLDEFIRLAAHAISSLDAKDLVRAAGTKFTVKASETWTADIREDVDRVRTFLPNDVVATLLNLTGEIEGSVAKEGALERAQRITDVADHGE